MRGVGQLEHHNSGDPANSEKPAIFWETKASSLADVMVKVLTPQNYLAPMIAKAMALQHEAIQRNSQQNNAGNVGIEVLEGMDWADRYVVIIHIIYCIISACTLWTLQQWSAIWADAKGVIGYIAAGLQDLLQNTACCMIFMVILTMAQSSCTPPARVNGMSAKGNETELGQQAPYRAMHLGENGKELQRDGELDVTIMHVLVVIQLTFALF